MSATEKCEGVETQERFDHDGFWKDLIERFWRELLRRALPDLYAEADLSKEARFLDKELRDTLLTPGAEDISFRMMLYCCLIFSHYRRAPVALAILTSPRLQEKLGVYEASQYGTRLL